MYKNLHYASEESKDLDQHAHMRRLINALAIPSTITIKLSGLSSCEGMFLIMCYVV